ncbi:MAG TPA: ABC transporter ATP-binding protein [Polyangiaceae bacterium]|nr:ABC transporter ATP-binding protein [Polyangiaceae bacterium]
MIHVERVSKAFGKLAVLRDVTLQIQPGERIALIGANGSGKTTLLRALLGLLRVSGRITIDGFDVATTPHHALRRLAYIPQIAPPLEAPVAEVTRAIATLRGIPLAAVAERANRLGLELGALGETRFRDLSGGMKQKLLAALALAAVPRVIVCDEPTANLDAAARRSFFEQLAEGPPDRISILSSHRIEEVTALVDRIVELEDGRVRRDFTLHEESEAARDSELTRHLGEAR